MTQKSAVLIYFAAEAWNHAYLVTRPRLSCPSETIFLSRLPATSLYQPSERYDNDDTRMIYLHLHSVGILDTRELPSFKQKKISAANGQTTR